MDAALRLYSVIVIITSITCFNPCFSGCRPATNRFSRSCCSSGDGVSILVLVDAALRQSIVRYTAYTRPVSILVLVDAALRQIYRYGYYKIDSKVSILVLVDAALRQCLPPMLCYRLSMFQSLF